MNRDVDRDTSALGELERIGAEVDEDLSKASDIPKKMFWYIVIDTPQ